MMTGWFATRLPMTGWFRWFVGMVRDCEGTDGLLWLAPASILAGRNGLRGDVGLEFFESLEPFTDPPSVPEGGRFEWYSTEFPRW